MNDRINTINECVTRRTLATSFFVISMSAAKRNLEIFPLVIAQLMETSPSGRNDETRDVVRWWMTVLILLMVG